MKLEAVCPERVLRFLKKNALIVLLAAAGLALALLGGASGKASEKNDNLSVADDEYNEKYLSSLETKLADTLSKIDGVGKTAVMLTLESGTEYIYATERKDESDEDKESKSLSSESSVTMVEKEDGRAALETKRLEPSVKGAVVVCEGAGDAKVRAAVVDTVSAVLGLTANRISVNKMS